MVPDGGEMPRPFLPSRDLDQSVAFYRALGFECLLHSADVAVLRIGRGEILLQARWVEAWAENAMMQLMVDDLDAWWAHVTALDLPAGLSCIEVINDTTPEAGAARLLAARAPRVPWAKARQ